MANTLEQITVLYRVMMLVAVVDFVELHKLWDVDYLGEM
jgi:hypothetical protein